MSLRSLIGQWCVPPGFHKIIKRSGSTPRKDVNETVTPIQLRHIRRYQFARRHLRGETVLDAACGSGYGSDLLEPLQKYIGVDYADYCIGYAQINYGAEHRRFIEGDLYRLSDIVQSKRFDTIVSFETLEHLECPERVLSAFLDLVRPEGRLILSIPLNHPDLVFHKRQYSHGDVRDLMGAFSSDGKHTLDEYLQSHLQIIPLTNTLPKEATGTWLGVMTTCSSHNSRPGDTGDALQRA